MEACQTYQLSVTNALDGTKNPDGDWNTMQDPNTTNIHTHGLHISGESPADDVLYVEILPGEGHSCKMNANASPYIQRVLARIYVVTSMDVALDRRRC